MNTTTQLQRARLAAKKLANSREFRARVWYLAGASLTPDSPRYSPHNNSHACSPVWRVYSPRMGKFPCQNLGRTESKLPQLCLETIRGYWSTLIRRKKILKKMNLLKVSKNWLVGMTDHRLYKQILENVNETNVCWKFFAIPAKGTCLLKKLIIFAHFSWSKCESLGFNFEHCQLNERENAALREIVDCSW